MTHTTMNHFPFVVQPLGGLANRMRVLGKCCEIASAAGVRMRVNWIKDDDCGALWTDLFEDTPLFPVQDSGASREVVWMSPRWYHRMPVLKYRLANRIDKMLTAPVTDRMIDEDEQHPEVFCRTVEQYLKQGKRVFLSTGSFLGQLADMSMFRPLPAIQHTIDDFLARIFSDKQASAAHLYGVHIRRTDNTWAIENSPIELFINALRHIIADDPSARFYLATDDKPTIEQLCDLFGERIVVREKEFSRITAQGIQDAVTDMWLLSKTKHIYGSFFSSFSEMASYIGGVPLTILQSAK